MKIKTSQSAFPMPENEYHEHEWGLTKREYFAAKIMAGFATSKHAGNPDFVAELSIEWADTLINKLNKGEQDEK